MVRLLGNLVEDTLVALIRNVVSVEIIMVVTNGKDAVMLEPIWLVHMKI
jgi:hypothetical protein